MSTRNETDSQKLHLASWQDRLQDAVDGALSATEIQEVKAHLSSCLACNKEHRRLVSIDAQLRNQLAAAPAVSASFDQRLFERIAAMEQDKRAAAKHREQQEHQARLTRLRTGWRQLLRFHLGNIIGVIVTLAAVIAAVSSTRSNIVPAFSKTVSQLSQHETWLARVLPHNLPYNLGLSTLTIAAIAASIVVAAIAIWYAKANDARRM